jgi:hypothetical protein
MGPRNWAMCDDDGHPLGDFTSIHTASRAYAWFPCRWRGRRRWRVRRANPAVRRWQLGNVPGLYRGRAIVGVCPCKWERGRRSSNVGYAHRPGPQDAPGAYGTGDVPSI